MSLEGAHYRASLWLRQAEDDLRAARVLRGSGQYSRSCFLAEQAGDKALKALLASQDSDRDKLYAPTRHPDALGDEAPMDVFGPEDAQAALEAAEPLLGWVSIAITRCPSINTEGVGVFWTRAIVNL